MLWSVVRFRVSGVWLLVWVRLLRQIRVDLLVGGALAFLAVLAAQDHGTYFVGYPKGPKYLYSRM